MYGGRGGRCQIQGVKSNAWGEERGGGQIQGQAGGEGKGLGAGDGLYGLRGTA